MAINGIDWVRIVTPLAAESWIVSLWQGIVLAFGVWLCLKLIPRISASTRFVVWSITFFTVTLLPLLRFIPMSSHTEAAVSIPQPVATHFIFRLDPVWAMVIAAVWLAGIVFQAIQLAVDLRRLYFVHKTAVPVSPKELGPELKVLFQQAGRRVDLCLSDKLDTPSAIGFFKPAVVLPYWLPEELSPAQIKQVVVHELAHLRRYDDWTNLLQRFIRMLMPINPVLYWIEKHLCFEREMACDDAVLDAEITAREYATCLTTLAGKRLAQRGAVLAPGAIEKQSELTRRVHSLLNRTRNSSLLVARRVAAAFLVAVVGGAIAFSQCPQWIAFAAPAKLQMPLALKATRMSELKLQHVALDVPVSPAAKHVKISAHPLTAAVQHRAVRKNTASAPASMQEALAVPDRQAAQNGQVLIVLSVWQSTSRIQIQQTAVILSEQRTAVSKTTAAAVQLPPDWLIFEI